VDQTLSKVTLEADERSRRQGRFWESRFGGMPLQQCRSRNSPIELRTALKIGGGQAAQVKRCRSVGDVDEWESQGPGVLSYLIERNIHCISGNKCAQ
jgi:hypothetical protein